MVKDSSGSLVPCNWEDALMEATKHLRKVSGNEVAGLAGGLVDAEVRKLSTQLRKIEVIVIQECVFNSVGPRCIKRLAEPIG